MGLGVNAIRNKILIDKMDPMTEIRCCGAGCLRGWVLKGFRFLELLQHQNAHAALQHQRRHSPDGIQPAVVAIEAGNKGLTVCFMIPFTPLHRRTP
jgi:hypothetical protein